MKKQPKVSFLQFFQFIFNQTVNVTARIHEKHIIIQIHVFINEDIVSEVNVQYKLEKKGEIK